VSIQPLLDRAARICSLSAAAAAALAALTGCQPQLDADYPEPAFFPAISSVRLPQIQPLSFAPAAEPEPAPVAAAEVPAVRMWTEWSADRALPGILRSQRAQQSRLPIVKEMFAKAGVAFPPAQLAFVAYKDEKQLEVWASSEEGGKAERIATYGICAASGGLGPKRFEGDHQVPEGHYVLQYGWAESNYHLEMKVSYPNMVDKVLGPKDRSLGGEIMIHGDCASIGCLAMSDERVEELWVMMKSKGDARVKVQIYPARDMDALLNSPEYASHHAFWRNLKEGKDRFDKGGRFFAVKADWHGVYMYE
jgi:L,D-transpeptidase catalytic domain